MTQRWEICGDCGCYRPGGHCVNPKVRKQVVGYLQPPCQYFDGQNNTPNQHPPQNMKQTENQENMATKKVCKDCGRELPIESFVRSRSGFTDHCKECWSKARRADIAKKKDAEPKPAPIRSGAESLPDDQLIEELRKRGFQGKLTRIFEVEV